MSESHTEPTSPGLKEKNFDATITTTPALHLDTEAASKDAALALLEKVHVAFDPKSAAAKAVLRKIDIHVMGIVWLVYLLQLMDKNSLSYAAILGIKTSTHLTSTEYSWLGSLVYFGYLGGDIPAAYLLQKFPLAKYFAIMTVIWGTIVCCHAACKDYAGLAVCRFLLGAVEVCTVPAVFMITGAFYTAEEQITRVAIWYTSSALASCFGGFFAWCLSWSGGFAWRAIFILYGGMTAATGVAMYLWLDATPAAARWLTDEEKVIALERLRGSKVGSEKWGFNRAQLKEAFMDPRIYIVFLLLVSTGLPNGGLTAFGPTLIQGFGFTVRQTTLLAMVSGAVETVLIAVAVIIAKHTSRGFAAMCAIAVGIIGSIIMLATPTSRYKVGYAGYVLTLQYPICIIFVIIWMTSAVGGTTKKFAFATVYQAGFAVGNIIGPQTFRANGAPHYYTAKYIMIAFIAVSGILIGVMQQIHRVWNKRRDAELAEEENNGVVRERLENEEFLDLTDFELRSFRYPL